MNTFLGHLHFWPSLILMNGIFLPMFIQGMAGFHRRAFDGGKAYEQISTQVFLDKDSLIAKLFHGGEAIQMIDLNVFMSTSAWLLAIAQVPFIFNFFFSIRFGKKVDSDNPWDATTLEWATPTPPPHGNFATEPIVYRGPYEYSVPGAAADFSPQFESDAGGETAEKEETD